MAQLPFGWVSALNSLFEKRYPRPGAAEASKASAEIRLFGSPDATMDWEGKVKSGEASSAQRGDKVCWMGKEEERQEVLGGGEAWANLTGH